MQVVVNLTFTNASIDRLSDQSLRRLLKAISSRYFQILESELDYFLKSCGLSDRQLQSIRDRMSSGEHTVRQAPKFYLKSIESGSIFFSTVLVATGLWFLSQTVFKSAKDTLFSEFSKTEMNRRIVKFLRNALRSADNERLDSFENAGEKGERWGVLAHAFAEEFKVGERIAIYEVTGLTFQVGSNKEMVVNIMLKVRDEHLIDENMLDSETVLGWLEADLDTAA